MDRLTYWIRMFVLIWAAVLLAARRNNAKTVELPGCENGSCITFGEAEKTAEAGLCVVINCSFIIKNNFIPQSVAWYRCDPSGQNCDNSVIFHPKSNTEAYPEFRGRVSLLEPHVNNSCSITISNLTKSDSGSYQLRVNSTNGTTNAYMLSSWANITVTDLQQKPTVLIPPLTAGQLTTLTCTAPGRCSASAPVITWTWRENQKNESHMIGNITSSHGQTSNLTFNPSAEHHGRKVTCKVSFAGNMTTEETVTLNVTLHHSAPNILNSSACVKQSAVLTCVCISEGFPKPTIEWPLLENYTEYSVITTVSNHTVNSTVTLTLKNDKSTTVECVSGSKNKRIKRNLIIQTAKEDLMMNLLKIATRLEIIIAFFIGFLLSTIICCLTRICHRKKKKTHGNLAETLEMVTTLALIKDGQAVENNHTNDQEAADGGGAVAAGKSDVDYSTIVFSKRECPAKVGNSQGTTETEYAEIKREAGEKQDGEDEQEMGMGEEDEEINQCVAEEGEGEDAALYSDVKDILSQI